MRGDFGERFRQDLCGRGFRIEAKTLAAGAAHPKRNPAGGAIKLALIFQDDGHDLIGGGRIRGAARCHKDRVCVRTVGDDGRVLAELEIVAIDLDRADAVPEVAADAAFGRGGGEQELLLANALHEAAMPIAVAPMRDQARDFDVVHRVDHRA